MNYRQMTEFFGIPVLGYKDRIIPEVELRKYQIIENLLIAGTQGVKNVVFDDGDFRLEEVGEGVTVHLRANGPSPAAYGIVDGFYFHAPVELVWTGLRTGYDYYLYVVATHELPHNCRAIRTMVSESRPSSLGLLMATIDLRDGTPKLEPYPDGKSYSLDVAKHCTDADSPHGRKLRQDELTVRRLVLTEEIQVGNRVLPIEEFAEAASVMAGRRVESFNFMSGGPSGIVLKASANVFSVSVSRRSLGSLTGQAGEVAVGYFGEDPEADDASEFCVRNTGDADIPMRAVAICG
jgi:hypothetical protein